MAKKIDINQSANEPYDTELEKHVDEMLAPEPSRKKVVIDHNEDTLAAEPAKDDVQPEILALNTDFSTAPLLPDAPTPKASAKVPVTLPEPESLPEKPIVLPGMKKHVVAPLAPAPEPESTPIDVPGLPITELEATSTHGEPELPIPEPSFAATQVADLDQMPDPLIDDKLDLLVNDIVAKEGDALLAAEDAHTLPPSTTRNYPAATSPKKHSPGLFKLLITSMAAKLLLLLVILGGLGAAAAIPQSRYYVLNAVGVRSTASVTIVDASTQQPLKNVTVKLVNQTTQTDDSGVARFQNLKLGPAQVDIEKRAFASAQKNITIGWGSNPLPSFDLSPTGRQYTFLVTDFLSGKPVATATAVSEYADANADDKGAIKLTLDKNAKDSLEVTIKSPGYREEKTTLQVDSQEEISIRLVAAQKHAFVSKRDGKLSIYQVDIDGQNEQLVLAGTGNERPDMMLLQSPGQNIAALVSTRDVVRNTDGYLLSSLNIINLDTGALTKVTQSEQIYLLGWNNGRLAYVQSASGASTTDPNRQRLFSYDYTKRDNKQLASSNYFNDALVAGDGIYYAPTGADGAASGNFTSVKFDGTDKRPILVGETWNAFRTDYEHIVLSVPGSWYQHTLGSGTAAKLEGQPANTTSRVYVDSPDGQRALWIDTRDGKGTLMSYDIAAKKDTVVASIAGLRQPIQWLSTQSVTFRVVTPTETADYVLSLASGEPRKIKDVTATAGNDTWYHYSN